MAVQPDNSSVPKSPSTRIYLQEACLRHQFIRSKDTSNVVERPERLRAINVGIAAILARLESQLAVPVAESDQDALADALSRINLSNNVAHPRDLPVEFVKSSATLDVLNNPAVKFVHGDIEGDVYLEKLVKWTKESRQKIVDEGCELPEGMPKGDLYRAFALSFVSTSR